MAHTKLNILFLNSISESIWGGLENWMELAGCRLARNGHMVWFAGRRGSQFLSRLSNHGEIKICPLDISGDFNPMTIRAIRNLAGINRIDVALCNFVKDVRLAGLARKFGRRYKIIWTPGVNLAQKSLSHRWLFSGFVDSAIVPSSHLKNSIVAAGYIDPSLFNVIPIGIDDARWTGSRDEGRQFLRQKFKLPEDAFACLVSGRFVRQKGHRYLIEAAAGLADKYPKIFYVLLGDGPLEADLRQQIESHNLTDRFIFCGLLENHQKAVFGADLYVHPAVIEPFGIVLVEAMAASLPVIASRVGGIPEVVAENETALLVDPAVPEQLTDAIERLYNTPALRESYGKAGYERFVRHFRIETMIERIEKNILEVTGV
jgi:glycosyltransferase involved in cell wall biosynthesis